MPEFGHDTPPHRAAPPGRGPARGCSSAVVAALVLVGACGQAPTSPPATSSNPSPASTAGASASTTPAASPAPSPAPSQDAAALYSRIEDQVIAERGLPAKQRLVPTILSEAEVKARIQAEFAKDNPPDEIATSEQTLKALGLLPPDASLGTLYVDMLGSQVAGFYDPKAKAMFVVSKSGSVGATEKATFAHEFTHALQDQSFGLEGIDVDAVGQGDRSLARLALVEGDATLVMARWMSRNLGPAELGELLNVDPEAQAQLAKMPAILRETLLFPYQQGLAFVNGLGASGGWEAVNRAFGRLPDSTEQILHPEKYQARREAAGREAGRGGAWRRPWAPAGPPRRPTRSASSSSRPGSARTGWRRATPRRPRPAGAATATCTSAARAAPTLSSCSPSGTRNRTPRRSWPRPAWRQPDLPWVAEARVVPQADGNSRAEPVAVLIASDAGTLGKLLAAAAASPRP